MRSVREIQSMQDLRCWLGSNGNERDEVRCRALVIIPGGGGKSSFVNGFQSKDVECADFDLYWNDQANEEKVKHLREEWAKISDGPRRRDIEDEYVLLKAHLSRDKWINDVKNNPRLLLLFVQTIGQAEILADERTFRINLLPADEFHQANLHRRRTLLGGNAPDDFQVCRRQWKENQEQVHLVYENFDELNDFLRLLLEFLVTKRAE